MDIKVFAEHKAHMVCGLTEATSVHDVIVALARSLKQTGRFYLFEKFTYSSPPPLDTTKRLLQSVTAPRLPRIMSPNERPVKVLANYTRCMQPGESVEFHLIRSLDDVVEPNTTSERQFAEPPPSVGTAIGNESPCYYFSNDEYMAQDVLDIIQRQQTELSTQSAKIGRVLAKIEKRERARARARQKRERLESKRALNTSELSELERQVDADELRREMDMSEYLRSQRELFESRLGELRAKLAEKMRLIDELHAVHQISLDQTIDYKRSLIGQLEHELFMEKEREQHVYQPPETDADDEQQQTNETKSVVQLIRATMATSLSPPPPATSTATTTTTIATTATTTAAKLSVIKKRHSASRTTAEQHAGPRNHLTCVLDSIHRF